MFFRKRKSIAHNPITIAVAGSARNVGVTCFCIAFCNFMQSKCGYATAYVELNNANHIRTIFSDPGKDRYKSLGVTFFPAAALSSWSEISRKSYEVFILDMGQVNHYTSSVFLQSTVRILISDYCLWNLAALETYFASVEQTFGLSNKDFCQTVHLLGNAGSIAYRKQFSHFKFKPQEIIPFFQNPFQIVSGEFFIFEQILGKENIPH